LNNLEQLFIENDETKRTSKFRHTGTINELQMSSYARQYYVM